MKTYLRSRAFCYSLGILILSFGAMLLVKQSPDLTERIYSKGIFPLVSSIQGHITGLLPFSIIEILYIFLAIGGLALLGWGLYHIASPLKVLSGFIYYGVPALATIFFGFVILCMPNYHRLPLEQQLGLQVREYSPEELYECTAAIIDELNKLAPLLERTPDGDLASPDGIYTTAKQSLATFNRYTAEHTALPRVYVPPKPIFFSNVLSELRLTGFYSPYTAEPNINKASPQFDIPATMCHELAHTAGIMREEEANFLAYLACRNSDDLMFQYSGYLLATTHLINAVYAQSPEIFSVLYSLYSPELEQDLAFIRNYWNQFNGPAAEISEVVNDTYLKLNDQTEGTKSYGMVVDLIIADFHQLKGAK